MSPASLPPQSQPFHGRGVPRQGPTSSLCPLHPLSLPNTQQLLMAEVSRDWGRPVVLRKGGSGVSLGRVEGGPGRERRCTAPERGAKACQTADSSRPGHTAPEGQPRPGAAGGCPDQEISLPNTSRTRGVSFMLHSGWKERLRYCLECSSLRLLRSASFWIILA